MATPYDPHIIDRPAFRPPPDPYRSAQFDFDRAWWRESVVYQVYIQSFKDSNDDGVGDFPGLTSRLDYIKDLGVDVIWVSPYFKSPLKDQGYDISDYRVIKEEFGTDKDFSEFVQGAHARSMRVLLDGVFNHTSDQVRIIHIYISIQSSYCLFAPSSRYAKYGMNSINGSKSQDRAKVILDGTGTSGGRLKRERMARIYRPTTGSVFSEV